MMNAECDMAIMGAGTAGEVLPILLHTNWMGGGK
jgi:hypothetical protein